MNTRSTSKCLLGIVLLIMAAIIMPLVMDTVDMVTNQVSAIEKHLTVPLELTKPARM